MPEGFFAVLTVILGLALGSFATALSYRIPRDISIAARLRSACPSCGHVLGIPDLVPVFSWLFLRGRCRHCGARIGWRYPLIELFTLLLCIGFYLSYGFSIPVLALFFLAPVVVSIADIDFGYKIIPDGLNLSVAALALAGLGAQGFLSGDPADLMAEAGLLAMQGGLVYGAAAAALRWGVMWVMKREPMGLGDVKFFAAAGMWLGPELETLSHFLLLSGLYGVFLALLWKKIRKEAAFPFGPALVAAFVTLLLFYPPDFLQEWIRI